MVNAEDVELAAKSADIFVPPVACVMETVARAIFQNPKANIAKNNAIVVAFWSALLSVKLNIIF